MKVFASFGLLVMSVVTLIAIGVVAILLSVPNVTRLSRCLTTTMYHVRLCPQSPNYVRLKEISPYMVHAVIAAEDTTFYSHKGLDWFEIRQSVLEDLRTGEFKRGGSTLTQQLAKNVFLDQEKNLWRKLKEAYLAHEIERHYGKNFILEKYLNVVQFGKNIFGVKEASRHYFQKSPAELQPLEAAFLAFLLPNPPAYSKSFRVGKLTPFASKMITIILRRMEMLGKLTPEAYQTAMIQLPNFPWAGVQLSSFQGRPDYNLDEPAQVMANVKSAAASDDPSLNQKVLDQLIQEEVKQNPLPVTAH